MNHKIFTILFIVLFSLSTYSQLREPIIQNQKTDACKVSPSLRGIKLGMSHSEISAKLNVPIILKEGNSSLQLTGKYAENELNYLLKKDDPIANIILTSDVGEVKSLGEIIKLIRVPDGSKVADIFPTEEQRKNEIFNEINDISLKLLDDRLVSISITYVTDKYKDSTDEEFYKEIFNLLGFSSSKHTFENGFVMCSNLTVNAFRFRKGLGINIEDDRFYDSLRSYAIKKLRERYEMEKEKLEEQEREKAKERGFKP